MVLEEIVQIEAEHWTEFPPLTPRHCHDHGPEPDRPPGVPMRQVPLEREVYGPLPPQTASFFRLAEQEAVDPTYAGLQDQVKVFPDELIDRVDPELHGEVISEER